MKTEEYQIKKGQFPWERNLNREVEEWYQKDNYKIIVNSDKKSTLILFSSHDLYYPNERSVFEEVICKRDRYEWENIAKYPSLKRKYGKIIFVRDIYKQYYVLGINSSVDSIDKMVLLLKELTKGDEAVVLAGVSAGGFVASIVGILMGASCVFSFDGQIRLDERYIERNPFLFEKCNRGEFVYTDVNELAEKGSSVPIYYLYSARSAEDVRQRAFCKCKTIHTFGFDSDKHGHPISRIQYIILFEKYNEVSKIFKKFMGAK